MYDVTAYRNLLRCCNRVWNQRKQPETNNAYYRNFLLTHVLSRFFWDELFKILFRKNFLLLPLLALSEILLLTRAPLVYDLCLGLICSWSVRLCDPFVAGMSILCCNKKGPTHTGTIPKSRGKKIPPGSRGSIRDIKSLPRHSVLVLVCVLLSEIVSFHFRMIRPKMVRGTSRGDDIGYENFVFCSV